MKKMGTKCVSNGRNGDQTQREQRAENSLMAEIRDIESALYLVVSLENASETTRGKNTRKRNFASFDLHWIFASLNEYSAGPQVFRVTSINPATT